MPKHLPRNPAKLPKPKPFTPRIVERQHYVKMVKCPRCRGVGCMECGYEGRVPECETQVELG